MIWGATDAPAAPGVESFFSPSLLFNAGAVVFFLFMFMTDRVHSRGAMDRAEKQIERLIVERNSALAERDEMIEVMKDFTHTASAILKADPPPAPGRRPSRRRDDER